ncbi:MAG TPA: hypothetical protein VF092_05820 [Longimicrobium sp.]
MRKLRLDPHLLRVESFDMRDGGPLQGTVHGHSYPIQCDPPSDSIDPAFDTCQYATCAGSTCWQSCNGTCNCGSVGCQPWSQAYTYCDKDMSCVVQCDPITP